MTLKYKPLTLIARNNSVFKRFIGFLAISWNFLSIFFKHCFCEIFKVRLNLNKSFSDTANVICYVNNCVSIRNQGISLLSFTSTQTMKINRIFNRFMLLFVFFQERERDRFEIYHRIEIKSFLRTNVRLRSSVRRSI